MRRFLVSAVCAFCALAAPALANGRTPITSGISSAAGSSSISRVGREAAALPRYSGTIKYSRSVTTTAPTGSCVGAGTQTLHEHWQISFARLRVAHTASEPITGSFSERLACDGTADSDPAVTDWSASGPGRTTVSLGFLRSVRSGKILIQTGGGTAFQGTATFADLTDGTSHTNPLHISPELSNPRLFSVRSGRHSRSWAMSWSSDMTGAESRIPGRLSVSLVRAGARART